MVESSDTTNLLINLGGPVSAALIVALITWVIRLLSERRKHETREHDELVTTVATLVKAVKEITESLGGTPATVFDKKRDGLIDSVAGLATQVASLTVVVNEHTETLRSVKGL